MLDSDSLYSVAVSGMTGKMGNLLARAIDQHPRLSLTCGLSRSSQPQLGLTLADLGYTSNGMLTDRWEEACLQTQTQAILDFSAPDTTLQLAALCAQHQLVLISGSTGFTQEEMTELASHAQKTWILHDTNMSYIMQWMIKLVHDTAKQFPTTEIDILDVHHRNKKDSPSGTALRLGLTADLGRQKGSASLPKSTYRVNDKNGPRPLHTIDYAVIRAGSHASAHEVRFTADNEQIRFCHTTDNRLPYVEGALAALFFVLEHHNNQDKRLLNMQDLVTFTT